MDVFGVFKKILLSELYLNYKIKDKISYIEIYMRSSIVRVNEKVFLLCVGWF